MMHATEPAYLADRHAAARDPRMLTRRSFLHTLLFAAPLMPRRAFADYAGVVADHGRVRPPVPVPDVKLVRSDGSRVELPAIVHGYATAVQLMFTSCTSSCPIQAAIFGHVQTLIPDMAAKKIQLLSLSVDPTVDTPQALTEWLQRFHAGSNWIAASPSAAAAGQADAQALQAFFGRSGNQFASHSTQVNLLNRHGQLVWRTVELPTAQEIAAILQKL